MRTVTLTKKVWLEIAQILANQTQPHVLNLAWYISDCVKEQGRVSTIILPQFDAGLVLGVGLTLGENFIER